MIWNTNSGDAKARQAYLDAQKKKEIGFVPNSTEGQSFAEASRRYSPTKSGYTAKSNTQTKSMKWEKDNLFKLPRSFGRSYNDKFANFTKAMGLDDSEQYAFRKYLDASEEGKTTQDEFKSLMTNADKRAQERFHFTKSEKQDEEPIVPKERGTLSRVFDALMLGNFTSANLANNFIQDKLKDGKVNHTWSNVKNAVKDSLWASNPLRNGEAKGAITFNNVLDNMGVKKDATLGYLPIGGVMHPLHREGAGFILDIATDPTTYLSGGTEAIVKGTGKVGVKAVSHALPDLAKTVGISEDVAHSIKNTKQLYAEASKVGGTAVEDAKNLVRGTMTDELAKKVVTEHALKGGRTLDEAQTLSEASKFQEKYHALMGTNRTATPLSVGLPGGKQLEFNGVTKGLQQIGDKLGTAYTYQKARQFVYGSKLGKLFSNRAGLMNLAKKDPVELYKTMDYGVRLQGMSLDKLKKESMFHDYVRQNLDGLTPFESKQLFDALQNKSNFETVRRVVGLGDMKEARIQKEKINLQREDAKAKVTQMRSNYDFLNQLRTKSLSDSELVKGALKDAEDEFHRNLASLDMEKVKGTEEHQHALQMLHDEASRLDEEMTKVPHHDEPTVQPYGMEEPVKPKRPYVRNPQEPTLDGMPKKPEYPAEPQLKDFVDEGLTELQHQSSGVLDDWNRIVASAKDGFIKQSDVSKKADEMSQLIFGKAGHISKSVYPNTISKLADMIDEGANLNMIRAYIQANPHEFDGRLREINSFVASKFGYGSGTKVKDWDEMYTIPVEKIKNKAKKEGRSYTRSEIERLTQLEKMRFERAKLRSKMMKMDMSQLLEFKKRELNAQMYHDVRSIQSSLNTPGKETLNVNDDWSTYIQNDASKVTGEDAFDEKLRHQYNDNDFASEQRRTNEFDSKENDFVSKKDASTERQMRQSENLSYIPYDVKESLKSDVLERLIDKQNKQLDKAVEKGKLLPEQADKKRINFESWTPSGAQWDYANQVVQQLGTVLRQNFGGRNWDRLTPKARNFALMLAESEVDAVRTGGKSFGQQILEKENKKLKELADAREAHKHSLAVQSEATIGSHVLVRNEKGLRIPGKISEIKTDDVGNVVYTVVGKNAELHNVLPSQVMKVNKANPVELILENTMDTRIYEEYGNAMKRHEDEIKRLDAEYERQVQAVRDANGDTLAKYQEELAQTEQKRADLKAQYTKELDQYNAKMEEFSSHKAQIDALNQASKEQWEEAVRESSKMMDEIFQRKQDVLTRIKESMDELATRDERYRAFGQQVEHDFKQFTNDSYERLRELERTYVEADDQLKNLDMSMDGKTLDEWQAKINELEDAIKSDDAFETWMEANLPQKLRRMDAKAGNPRTGDLGKLVLDTRTDYNAKIKQMAKELRGFFFEMGENEVKSGDLKPEQFEAMMREYLPHVVTPEGQAFFSKYTLQEVDGRVIPVLREKGEKMASITQDLGFDEIWSPYSKSRTFKIQNPDGTWNERPTIEQINQYMHQFLDGKNAFSENLSDVFITRALKHTELMYDYRYMNEMMNTFGLDVAHDFIPQQGFKNVMNFGIFKRNVRDLSNLQFSLQASEDVGGYFMYHKWLNSGEPFVMSEDNPILKIVQQDLEQGLKPDAERFMTQYYTPERSDKMYKEFMDDVYRQIGLKLDTYRQTITPLVELDADKAHAMTNYYHGVVGQFQARLTELEKKYEKLFNDGLHKPEDIKTLHNMKKRIEHDQKKLDSLEPFHIKQMNEYIVNQANGARQMQMAKDKSRLLAVYDKFTHWLKLNQTAIMPSFHARNAMSNLFQTWLAVGKDIADFDLHKSVFQSIKNSDELHKLRSLPPIVLDGQTYYWDELYTLAESHGAVSKGFFAKDVGAETASKGFLKPLKDVKGHNLDFTDTENFVGYKKGTEFGNKVENQARFFQFVSFLKQGKTPEEATGLVNKFLFDYGDLTRFERNVMKRIFPYYTWLRKNGRLQVTQLFENPAKYRGIARTYQWLNMQVPEDERVETQYLSPFAKDWIQTPWFYTSTDKDGNKTREPILYNPNMPYMDLTRLPNPLHPVQTVKDLVPQLNSPLKAPIELGTQKNFFFDENMYGDKDTTGDKVVKSLDYLGNQVAPYTAVEGLIQKEGKDKALHALNISAGQKFLSYDYESSKKHITDKYLGHTNEKQLWIDKQLSALSNLPTHEQNNVSRIMDDYLGGKELTKKNTGKYYPFISVMKKFGIEDAKSRQWVATTLDSTDLEKYVLGSDFATGKVVHVRDGDTVDLLVNGKKIGGRLNLIDTPETVDPRVNEPMPYGKEASNWTKSALNGENVRVVLSKNTDKYGRYVVYLYVNGEDYNKQLIDKGYAQVRYANLSANPYRLEQYKQAQMDAYNKNKGIWQIDGYADPQKDAPYNKKNAMKKYLELLQEQSQ